MKILNIKKPNVVSSQIRRISLLASFLLIIFIFLTPGSTAAQDDELEAPFYLIQDGDSLWGISIQLGIPMTELQAMNGINNPNELLIGMHLLIPAPKDVNGQIDTRLINFGDTLESLSHKYYLSEASLAQLNRYTSPSEVIAGTSIIVPIKNENQIKHQKISLVPGQSLMELAMQNGKNLWELMFDNNLSNSWEVMPGKSLRKHRSTTSNDEAIPGGLPAVIEQIEISPFPPAQGQTMVIKINVPSAILMNGSFIGRELNFFQYDDKYVSIQGVHTLTDEGAYPLTLEGQLADGTKFIFSQSIMVQSTQYIFDPMLIVDPETVDPNVTKPEAALWASLGKPVTQEKMWEGLFSSPVSLELTECWTSFFGNRRAYNGSLYEYFHSGLDFCGRVGTELYAPAAGKVVFTDSLIVRGNVVVIDHGWGVYSAYDHLSEILVQPGDFIQTGQTIGLGGETGRTTGPHLHWEVWVGGVQVDPIDWLEQVYP